MDSFIEHDDLNNEKIIVMVQNIIYERNLFMRMQVMTSVLNMISDEIAKKVKARQFEAELDRIISDELFYRQVERISKLLDNTETALEYLGEDYISNPEYAFDSELYSRMNSIHKKITVFCGKLIKELINDKEKFI